MGSLVKWQDWSIQLSIKRGDCHACTYWFFSPKKIKFTQLRILTFFISAEIPDQGLHPQLYEAVKKFMLHGRCSSNRCLDQHGKCSKHFPKQFNDITSWKDNRYPDHKRSDLGCTIEKTSFTFVGLVSKSHQSMCKHIILLRLPNISISVFIKVVIGLY